MSGLLRCQIRPRCGALLASGAIVFEDISTMYFLHPSLRPDEIQQPTRRKQNPAERPLRRRSARMRLRRALWRVGAVLVYGLAVAVITLNGTHFATLLWQAVAH
jgi:hypothetical protein